MYQISKYFRLLFCDLFQLFNVNNINFFVLMNQMTFKNMQQKIEYKSICNKQNIPTNYVY